MSIYCNMTPRNTTQPGRKLQVETLPCDALFVFLYILSFEALVCSDGLLVKDE